jgi:hypothetical protein
VLVCGAGMAIGAGVAMYSTAFAMPCARASMRCTPTVSGVISTVRGDGGGLYASVIAEGVVADAGAAEEMLDASPMARTAINAVTAPPTDRINATGESCRKNRPAHSRIAERAPTQARYGPPRAGRGRTRSDLRAVMRWIVALVERWQIACRGVHQRRVGRDAPRCAIPASACSWMHPRSLRQQ